MVDEEGTGEEEDITRITGRLWPFVKADDMAAGQRTEELDVVDDGIGDRPTSAISRRRVQRGALSLITTRRTISTRQHPVPVQDETDPQVTFKTLSRATAAIAKQTSRTTATRGGIAMASGRVTDWAQSLHI